VAKARADVAAFWRTRGSWRMEGTLVHVVHAPKFGG
jgi:hypothetical protein